MKDWERKSSQGDASTRILANVSPFARQDDEEEEEVAKDVDG